MMTPLLDQRDVWLIGGGGKTTLMYRLAAAWASRGETVVCTTTTRIRPPEPHQCPDLRLGDRAALVLDLRRRPAPVVTLASRSEHGKCQGFSADDTLALRAAADHLVVEADGAAGRPVKAHAPHEPVIAARATCVVAVVGAWCVGAPLTAEHVHRPERFAALAGRPPGAPLDAQDVARVILHAEGWLRAVPPGAAFHVVVTGSARDSGLARALRAHPNASRLAGVHAAPPA
jgi:probable selenium-dependent hydroxylase accessory protein YqeC